MGLKEALNEESTKRLNRRFRVLEILEILGENDRKVLEDALADRSVKPIWIVRALKKQGIDISENAVTNYRAWCHVSE